MTTDDHGQTQDAPWPTLTEAAARTGYTREALRQRMRRGKLRAIKDNTSTLRLDPRDLADLPPPDQAVGDHSQPENDSRDVALDVLGATVADLRSILDNLRQDLERTRLDLGQAQRHRLDDHGRAERSEAEAATERARAERAEARLAAAEAALAEVRTPLILRIIQAVRGRRTTT
jgi:hypothetical protein